MARRLTTLELPESLEGSLSAGHPWVYRDRLDAAPDLETGTWVRVVAGSFSGFGAWDATSAIAVRIFSRKGIPDATWLADRIRSAWELRAPLRESKTTAYRWVHGEGDGLPGIVVDLYGRYAVVRVDNPSLASLIPWVAQAVGETTDLAGVLLRESGPDGARLLSLEGRLPPRDLIVEENGLRLRANLFEGQKTGLFLDQRDNRRTVEALSAGASVLNLFAYTGAFSLHAVRGGAARVTSVDASSEAVAAARENFELNGFEADAHVFEVADVFDYLRLDHGGAAPFDVVICDPPTFARRRTQAEAARHAYVKLNAAALAVTRVGGWFVSSSCTTQVGVEAFKSALAAAARRANRTLQIVHDAGQPLDHPVPAGHPDGRYLKFVVCRVSAIA